MAADERNAGTARDDPRDDPRADPRDDPRDELLAIRCQLGEPQAFDELVERWHEPLWRYVRRLSEDDEIAADALQDIWLRVVRGLPRLREPSRLRAWLFGIARRTLMDGLRRRYALPEMVAIDGHDVPEPESELDMVEEHAMMQAKLEELPFIERETLVLFYLRELSLEGIAEVTAVPIGTVKSRLHRARRMLRERMMRAESES